MYKLFSLSAFAVENLETCLGFGLSTESATLGRSGDHTPPVLSLIIISAVLPGNGGVVELKQSRSPRHIFRQGSPVYAVATITAEIVVRDALSPSAAAAKCGIVRTKALP